MILVRQKESERKIRQKEFSERRWWLMGERERNKGFSLYFTFWVRVGIGPKS